MAKLLRLRVRELPGRILAAQAARVVVRANVANAAVLASNGWIAALRSDGGAVGGGGRWVGDAGGEWVVALATIKCLHRRGVPWGDKQHQSGDDSDPRGRST